VPCRQALVCVEADDTVDTKRPDHTLVDLRYELHHRSDLVGQRCRAWLKLGGVDYGGFGLM
jgi:hypothetical protein